MGGKAGDWDDFPERAARCISVAKAARSGCVFTKGLQPEYVHLKRPDWARIEVQVRPAKEAKDAFSKLSPIEVWGASRWTRDIAAKVLEQHVDPHPAGTTYRLTDQKRRSGGCANSTAHTLWVWLRISVIGLALGSRSKRFWTSRPRAVDAQHVRLKRANCPVYRSRCHQRAGATTPAAF